MSVRVMADVYDVGPDDAVDHSVLLALANHCNDEGKSCFPSVQTIARMTRRSQKTVERSLQALEAGEWIVVKRGVGRGVFSTYTVNVVMLKRRQSVAFCEEDKRRLPRPEKATPTTVKGDSDGLLYGRPISNPSGEPVTPPTPASGGERSTVCEAEEFDRQRGAQAAIAANSAGSAELLSVQNGGNGGGSGGADAAWSVATLEAVNEVMRRSGFGKNARLCAAIGDALKLRCTQARCDLQSASTLAIERVEEYRQAAGVLRYTWSWSKFFAMAYWVDDRMWPYTPEYLERLRRRF